MWLREVPLDKLTGTRVSFKGKEGIILGHYYAIHGLIISIDLAGNSTPADYLYDIAKDQFEVLTGDQLPITQPAPVEEKPCKNKWCKRMNYTTETICWHCETENPTDY
jgi:hypothetical protein